MSDNQIIFLSKRAAATKVDLHSATLMRMVRARRFPQPVRTGPGRISFIQSEVEEWMQQRIAERDAALAARAAQEPQERAEPAPPVARVPAPPAAPRPRGRPRKVAQAAAAE